MQTVSSTYSAIMADPNHWFETKLTIDSVGTFEGSALVSVKTNIEMLQASPTIGKAVAGEIDVTMLLPGADIPTMATLRPYVRVCNDEDESEWLPQGVFFIDTRERTKNNNGLDILTIHGFDAMLKAEKLYAGRITADSIDTDMVDEIAYQMGVTVDSRTYSVMANSYTVPFPSGYTYREVLGYIAAMYVGCFVMTEEGNLRLISILELPPETNYLIENMGDAITFGGDRILV